MSVAFTGDTVETGQQPDPRPGLLCVEDDQGAGETLQFDHRTDCGGGEPSVDGASAECASHLDRPSLLQRGER